MGLDWGNLAGWGDAGQKPGGNHKSRVRVAFPGASVCQATPGGSPAAGQKPRPHKAERFSFRFVDRRCPR